MSSKFIKITAAVLIFLGIYINIPFSILGAIFDYPEILRQPTGKVLTQFHQGGATLILVWYAFALCPILLILAAKLIQQILKDEHEKLSSISATFGVLAGIFQALGLIRWVFMVPLLANAYADPGSSEEFKMATMLVFRAFHQYAGVAIGEHLGQLFTALWLVMVSAAMLRSSVFKSWQGFAGIVISLMMFAGLAEGFSTVIDFDPWLFGFVTPVSFILLSLWMISLGVILLMYKQPISARISN